MQSEAGPPLFIVGAARSGTTLVRVLLNRHPDLAIPGESHFIPDLWRRRHAYGKAGRIEDIDVWVRDMAKQPWFRSWGVPVQDLERGLSEALSPTFSDGVRAVYQAFAELQGKRRWGDKTPEYVNDLLLLASLFPDALFVHVLRDGRDVALSVVELGRLHRSAATAALFWRRQVSNGRRAGAVIGPGRYMELAYESLVDDPERELRGLCHFLGLPFDRAMLDHDTQALESIPPRIRYMHSRIALPPTRGLRDWTRQMAAHDVAEFETIGGRELLKTGYQLSSARHGLVVHIRAWTRMIPFALRYIDYRIRRVARRGRRRARLLLDRMMRRDVDDRGSSGLDARHRTRLGH
jgi:hypothetical protein